MLRLTLTLVTALLAGCAGPRPIVFDVPQLAATPEMVDDRNDGEKYYQRCGSVASSHVGMLDEHFKTPKIEFLRARLHAAFGTDVRTVIVKHFQNCMPAPLSGAAFAGISLPLAIAVDALGQSMPLELVTHIDLIADGERVAVIDRRPITRNEIWHFESSTPEAEAALVRASEDTIARLIRALKAKRVSGK
jgi:hypothetical protein